MPNIGKSNVLKVNLGWAIIIAAGIGSFVLARDSVLAKRQEHMKKKQTIVDTVEKEALEAKDIK